MKLKDMLYSISAIQYRGVFYVVYYFNYADESETGELEFVCIDHENCYLVDNISEPMRITESMLKEDTTSELYVYSQVQNWEK